MLGVILENNLVRFSSIVRAVDVWFGFGWDAMSTGKAAKLIETATGFLADPRAADKALADAARLAPAPRPAKKKALEIDPAVEQAYLALWSKAFVDVEDAATPSLPPQSIEPHATMKKAGRDRSAGSHLSLS